MTREEAVDILIEAHDGTAKEMRSRRSKDRRAKLLAGDHRMIRAMVVTASAHQDGKPSKEVNEAIRVLTS